jgi:hypothetical protein
MKITSYLVSALLVVAVAVASDRTKIALDDGRVLNNAKILAIGERTATILHGDRIETFSVDNVPREELARAQPRLEAATAENDELLAALRTREAARAEIEAATKEQERRAQTCLEFGIQVTSVTRDGFLGRPLAPAKIGRPIFRTLTAPLPVRPDAMTKRGMGTGADYAAKQTVDVRETRVLPDTVFIECATEGIFDGKKFAVKVWPAGTMRYTTVMNASATVPKFTTRFERSSEAK